MAPATAFYYQPGGSLLFGMGPYYLTPWSASSGRRSGYQA
jgi:hypothetical protein